MKNQKSFIVASILAVLAILSVSTPARADMGIPMLMFIWPGAWVMLVPVVIIEACVAKRVLRVSWWPAIKIAALTNIVTTVVGIPVTWAATLCVEMLLGMPFAYLAPKIPGHFSNPAWGLLLSAWIFPGPSDDEGWLIPGACLAFCVPMYLMSAWLEGRIARRMLQPSQDADATKWGWQANMASYIVIVALLIFLLVYNVVLR